MFHVDDVAALILAQIDGWLALSIDVYDAAVIGKRDVVLFGDACPAQALQKNIAVRELDLVAQDAQAERRSHPAASGDEPAGLVDQTGDHSRRSNGCSGPENR
jgi:hypothetical protein